jgi:hypothetical protein
MKRAMWFLSCKSLSPGEFNKECPVVSAGQIMARWTLLGRRKPSDVSIAEGDLFDFRLAEDSQVILSSRRSAHWSWLCRREPCDAIEELFDLSFWQNRDCGFVEESSLISAWHNSDSGLADESSLILACRRPQWFLLGRWNQIDLQRRVQQCQPGKPSRPPVFS